MANKERRKATSSLFAMRTVVDNFVRLLLRHATHQPDRLSVEWP